MTHFKCVKFYTGIIESIPPTLLGLIKLVTDWCHFKTNDWNFGASGLRKKGKAFSLLEIISD